MSTSVTDRLQGIVDRPVLDWITTVLVSGGLLWLGVFDRLETVPAESQRATYSAAASVLGVIAGFVATSTFAFAGFDNPYVNDLRRQYGSLINRTLIGCFTTLAICAALCVGSIVAAPGWPAPLMFLPASALGLLKMFRIAALAWILLATQAESSRGRPR